MKQDVATFYRQRSLGSDHGNHLLWAALHPDQSCFQRVRVAPVTDPQLINPWGISRLRQPVVGL